MVNAYYNGFFGKTEDIKISLNDRAYFFGDGIYDAAIGRNGKVFALEEHLERFYKNSKLLDITLPIGINEIKNNIIKIAELCEYSSYFIYFQLTRSSAKRIHTYDNSLPANLLITATEFTPPDRSEKLKLITTEDIRYELCHIKTLNLLPSVMASQKAKKAFADEAVFVRKGIVTECSHSNIHYLKDDILFTHPADNFILPGISRAHLLKLCEKYSVTVKECKFGINELLDADEILVTSTSKLCLMAERINDRTFNVRKNSRASFLSSLMHDEFMKETM